MHSSFIVLADADDTQKLGARIAAAIHERAVITVSGPLGAGKTTLAQGLARALNIKDAVTSPTFTMLNEYHSGRLPFYHLDLYRLHDETGIAPRAADLDLLEAELDEILESPAVVLVEWPEYFQHYFVELDSLHIDLQFETEGSDADNAAAARRASFAARGPGAARIVEAAMTITN